MVNNKAYKYFSVLIFWGEDCSKRDSRTYEKKKDIPFQ
jgi:hypothetical protein